MARSVPESGQDKNLIELLTVRQHLKMLSTDGERKPIHVADAEILLRLIQRVSSPEADPPKRRE